MADDEQLEDLSKHELKERLRAADEPVSGNKSELIERLRNMSDDDGPGDDSSESGDVSEAATDEPTDESTDESSGEPAADGSWSDHLERVRSTVRQLTSHDVDSFVGVSTLDDDDGWSYTVQLTESRRVPSTADLVAVYRVDVRSDGELAALEQIGRGRRDQVSAR